MVGRNKDQDKIGDGQSRTDCIVNDSGFWYKPLALVNDEFLQR
jgi:hypothetical protein